MEKVNYYLPVTLVSCLGLVTFTFATAFFVNPVSAAERLPLSIRTVVLRGDFLPGINGPLSSHTLPQLNENGHVAFIGTADGLRGIWKESDEGLVLVVKEGDMAPGTGGDTFDRFEDLIFNDAGRTAFVGSLANPGPRFKSGIWIENDSELSKVVQRGDIAPIDDDPEDRFFDRPFDQDISNIFPFVLNNNNDLLFYSELRFEDLSIAGEALAYFVDEVLTVVRVTRFPGTTGGLLDISRNNTLGDNGGFGVVTRVQEGFAVSGGPIHGDTAPDTDGATFVGFGRPDINNTGQLVFRASLTGSASSIVTANDNSAIYTTATGLTLIARENDVAPGTSAVYADMTGSPLINDSGKVLFENVLRDAPAGRRWGVWTTAGNGVLRAVLLAGDPVPGAEPGTVFRAASSLTVARTWILNKRDNLVFIAQMEGPEVDASNDIGLFAEIRGELVMVLREGDPLEVAPGDMRIISAFSDGSEIGIAGGTGNGDGRRSAFNNRDQLTFAATFTDGSSGIFFVDDLEIAVAGGALQPELSIDAEGHPAVGYTVIPGFEYSIERAPDLFDRDAAISVSPPSLAESKERRRFTDTGITIVPGNSLDTPMGFYLLRYEKKSD